MRKLKFNLLLVALAATGIAEAQTGHIDGANSIREVLGDGAKITTVVLRYSEPINGTKLNTADFKVEGRQIKRAYTSNADVKGRPVSAGRYVVLELQTNVTLPTEKPGGGPGMNGGPQAGRRDMNDNKKDETFGPDSVMVSQVAKIYTAKGKPVKASTVRHTAVSNKTLVADDFKQFVYHDKQTGVTLPYNLYVPAEIEKGKLYPIVMFIHDASGAGKDVRNTLLQGNGATVWASPEWQKEHPCFVLAPQFRQVTVDDNYNTTPDLDACLNLLDSLIAANPVDTDRIYTTGQSMGCMSSYVLMLRRPQLFAAAMLVAGQWNPDVMAPLAKKNLWLLSCKGDQKSSAGVASAIEVWKDNGGIITEQEWPLEAGREQRDAEVASMLGSGGNIHYTHFAGGNHRATWCVAYSIDGVREWLFRQHRSK